MRPRHLLHLAVHAPVRRHLRGALRGRPARTGERRMTTRDALNGRQGGLTRWARENDPTGATAPARRAMAERFEREVDPDGVLDPAERAKRASRARRAHMASLARKSADARRRRAA